MLKLWYCCLFIFLAGIIGCDSQQPVKEENYYSVKGFLQSELSRIDSMPLAVFHYTIDGEKADTALIEKEAFRNLIQPWFIDDVTPDHYTENSFIDAGLNTISLTYQAKHDSISIQKTDILLNLDENSSVRTVYMERYTNDTLQKLLWIPRYSCQLTTITGTNQQTLLERFVWDEKKIEDF